VVDAVEDRADRGDRALDDREHRVLEDILGELADGLEGVDDAGDVAPVFLDPGADGGLDLLDLVGDRGGEAAAGAGAVLHAVDESGDGGRGLPERGGGLAHRGRSEAFHLALERDELLLGGAAELGVDLAGGAADLVEPADGAGRVEGVERLAEVFGLSAEEGDGGLGLLDGVLDLAEPVQDDVEALGRGRAALTDLLAHLRRVEPERLEALLRWSWSRRQRGSRTP
jgi:hypothetical protein